MIIKLVCFGFLTLCWFVIFFLAYMLALALLTTGTFKLLKYSWFSDHLNLAVNGEWICASIEGVQKSCYWKGWSRFKYNKTDVWSDNHLNRGRRGRIYYIWGFRAERNSKETYFGKGGKFFFKNADLKTVHSRIRLALIT